MDNAKHAEEHISPKEAQYGIQFEELKQLGPVGLGPIASHSWRTDPRHLGFFLARYKFCAKMLAGKSSVLEVGCGDGFGMRVVLQEVESAVGIDFDPLFTRWAAEQAVHEVLRCSFVTLDITQQVPSGRFDGAYSLDVIEHIPSHLENQFIRNICHALSPDGVCIIGTPNITSQPYASTISRRGHVNCKSAEELKILMSGYFDNVFLFGMNDEVLHTGFCAMAHYLFAMGVGVRE